MRFDIILLLILCTSSVSLHVPDTVNLSVGQPFTFNISSAVNPKVSDASGENFPTWLEWNQETKQLRGVPEVFDIGEHFIRISDSTGTSAVIEIRIAEESENPCGDHDTSWMEIIFKSFVKNLSIDQKIDLIDTLCNYFKIDKRYLRLYTESYKNEVRRYEITDTNIDNAVDPRSTVVTMKVYCEQIDEDGVYIIDSLVAIDKESLKNAQEVIGWRLTKGKVLSRQQRHQGHSGGVLSEFSGFATNEPHEIEESRKVTAKPPTTTTRITRTTRRVIDHAPVRLNSLPTFSCKKGAVCELAIPQTTFIDAEDGDTRSLSLSIFPLSGEYNWLTVDKNRQVLKGICLKDGDFEFRLDARDSANQIASAAFRVSIQEAPPSNHLFTLDVQQSYSGMLEPGVLYSFAVKLANALGDRLPTNIIIKDAKAGNRSLTSITWYNSSLPFQICHKKAIDEIKHQIFTRKRDRLRNDFVRAMDSRFLVRNAKMELVGTCKEDSSSERFKPTTTMLPALTPEVSPKTSNIILPVLLAALLIILLLIAILVCFIIRKKSQKTVQSEYVSKGLPVVFPEEIPQEDEGATVATPMLVKEERPPLLVSQHDNPLYKPPPPLSSASSPRPRNSTANQRLPPPYIPP